MDPLSQVYLDNSLRNYLIVGLTILFAILLKKFLSRHIAAVLYRVVQRASKAVDKKKFVDLVLEPMEWFLIILISIFSLDKLHFPIKFRFRIYHSNTMAIMDMLGRGIIIISFFWLVLRFIDFIALVLEKKALQTDDKTDEQLIVFFRDFLKVIIGIICILSILKVCFHQHIGNLLTGLSLVGAAMALAAKESLENLIASFIIFFDKPFFTGDTLRVNNITGTVERIGLRSTRIRTADKTLVTVPNKQMVDSIVDNFSLRTKRRAEIHLELANGTSLYNTNLVIEGTKKILERKGTESSSVFFKEISKNGMTIIAEYFTEPFTKSEFDKLKQDVNLEIKKLLEETSVELAGETNTIVIDSTNQGNVKREP